MAAKAAEKRTSDIAGRAFSGTAASFERGFLSVGRIEVRATHSRRGVGASGPARAAQKHKVMVDALRLAWAASDLYPAGNAQKILALADDEAAAHLVGRSWMKAALEHLGVTVRVVKIPDELRERIRDAQRRQFR